MSKVFQRERNRYGYTRTPRLLLVPTQWLPFRVPCQIAHSVFLSLSFRNSILISVLSAFFLVFSVSVVLQASGLSIIYIPRFLPFLVQCRLCPNPPMCVLSHIISHTYFHSRLSVFVSYLTRRLSGSERRHLSRVGTHTLEFV